ncbi:hypothetical protein F4780DRAFT_559353 [Xylariomycetidae sp. FL0641]|nr:hypothetical protein F4780DRAFT_559353 [Xylariomycetidae sp. FL0641]
MATHEEQATKTFVERSRHERRHELAKLARERNADLSVIFNLSWRVRSRQAHLDYVGGLDTNKVKHNVQNKLSALGNLQLPLPKIPDLPPLARLGGGEPEQVLELAPRPPQLGLADALNQAAPIDVQHSRRMGQLAGESAEEHEVRVRGETEQQRRRREAFRAILAQIDTEKLADLALDHYVQRRRVPGFSPTSMMTAAHHRPPAETPRPQVSEPFFGSTHVFYVLQFSSADDGSGGAVGGADTDAETEAEGATAATGKTKKKKKRRRRPLKWVFKIPVAGTPDVWDQAGAEALRTEALLLHALRTRDGVPVPEIVDADCSPHNAVHVPYLLMQFVTGRRLEDVWFAVDEEVSAEQLQQRRRQILRNVARAVAPLGRYRFTQGGTPLFDPTGELLTDRAGSLRMLDIQAMVDRWFAREDCEPTPIHRLRGPFDAPAAMYAALLDDDDPAPGHGVDCLLRLLLGLVPEPPPPAAGDGESGDEKTGDEERRRRNSYPFVLAHPDLSLRNIVVARDGVTIKAILGWDGARAAPRSGGLGGPYAFPRWLVRDFNPAVWRWRPEPNFWLAGGGGGGGGGATSSSTSRSACNRFEDPPWVLRDLREVYVKEVKKVEEVGGGKREGETRSSLLALSLAAAAHDPRCRTAVLRRLLEKCSRSFEELDFDGFVDTLAEGRCVDPYRLRCLARNVADLVARGFVRGAVVW